jgi:peroxiredoxin
MEKLKAGDHAPDFSLPGADGEIITLSDVYRRKNVILVFNIGFS